MVGVRGALHRWLFGRHSRDLYVLVLAGVIFGTLFASLSSLAVPADQPQRLRDAAGQPVRELQPVDPACSLSAGRARRRLGVWGRGCSAAGRGGARPGHAIGLGRRTTPRGQPGLVIIAVLVSVSTALVGPVMFLGVLVANLARQLTRTFRHRIVLPAASLIAMITLMGGQLVLEQVLGMDTALSVVINFGGGIYFIVLLVRESHDDRSQRRHQTVRRQHRRRRVSLSIPPAGSPR